MATKKYFIDEITRASLRHEDNKICTPARRLYQQVLAACGIFGWEDDDDNRVVIYDSEENKHYVDIFYGTELSSKFNVLSTLSVSKVCYDSVVELAGKTYFSTIIPGLYFYIESRYDEETEEEINQVFFEVLTID